MTTVHLISLRSYVLLRFISFVYFSHLYTFPFVMLNCLIDLCLCGILLTQKKTVSLYAFIMNNKVLLLFHLLLVVIKIMPYGYPEFNVKSRPI